MIVKTKYTFGYDAVFLCLVPPFPWVILVKPEYANNRALIEHERQHWRQYCAAPFTYAFKMLTDWKYRYEMETECYAKQILTKAPEDRKKQLERASVYGRVLAAKYRLPITAPEAINAIRRQLARPEPAPLRVDTTRRFEKLNGAFQIAIIVYILWNLFW